MTRPFLLVLALSACAQDATPRGVAGNLDRCLTRMATWPLATRCQCLTDADQRCVVAELGRGCWRGLTDPVHEWTIAACDSRSAP